MTNILTAIEAADVLRVQTTDTLMLSMLPAVDAYIRTATGHDWAADSPINEQAKAAARMLLSMWYDTPTMMASGTTSLAHGFTATLVQLEALAARYKIFEGLNGAGAIPLLGACEGDTVTALIGVVNVTGDQSTKFESVISADGSIQQTSTDDLTKKYYRVLLTSPE